MKILTLWVLLASATSFASQELLPSPYTRHYKADDGISVTVVHLLPRDRKEALILFRGEDSKIDGTVLLHKMQEIGSRNRPKTGYSTKIDGEYFQTVVVEKTDGHRHHKVRFPERWNEWLSLTYDPTISEGVESLDILTKHLDQKRKIATLSSFNRNDRIKSQRNYFRKEIDAVQKACGKKIPATIQWKTVTNEHLKRISIYGYCSRPLEAVRRLCRKSDDIKKIVLSRVKSIRCQFGKKLGAELQKNGTFDWTAEESTPNQADYLTNFLKNNL